MHNKLGFNSISLLGTRKFKRVKENAVVYEKKAHTRIIAMDDVPSFFVVTSFESFFEFLNNVLYFSVVFVKNLSIIIY